MGTGRAGRLGTQSAEAAAARGVHVAVMNRRKRTKPTRTAHVPMMRSHDWPFSLNAMDSGTSPLATRTASVTPTAASVSASAALPAMNAFVWMADWMRMAWRKSTFERIYPR